MLLTLFEPLINGSKSDGGIHVTRKSEWWEEGKGKNMGGEEEVTALTFLWFTIFMSRSSLNALFAYVSF